MKELVNFRFSFKNLGYLPRWIVLCLDITVIVFSLIVTYFSFQGLKLNFINKYHLLEGTLLYLAVNIFYFWVYRTYSGIVRYSSYVDALKLLLSQFSTFATIIIFNFIFILLNKHKLYLTTGAFFNAVISFSFLFLYRLIVKQAYENYFSGTNVTSKSRIIIYGTDANAMTVANALAADIHSKYKVLGFIDKTNNNTNKRILNLPIFEIKRTVPLLLRQVKADAILIADKSLNIDEKVKLADQCVDYNFKVLTLPVVTDFKENKSISKSIKTFDIHDLLERKPIVLNLDAVSKNINNKIVLITGAAGSIGSEIVRQILHFKPQKILILDQAETPLNTLTLEIMQQNKVDFTFIIGDVRNKAQMEEIFQKYKPNIVFHAAAYKHVPMMESNPAQAVFTNVMGSKILADLAEDFNVEKFVMVSTDKAVNPSNVMGASKRIAEMYVQSKQYVEGTKTKFITTRFGNVLGSNGSVVPLFTNQIQNGGPITITHPDIIRYFMTIPEACQLVLEAGAMGNGGEIFIFDMGKPVKIIDLARKMIKLAGYIPDKDIQIKVVGLRPGEKLYEELLHDTSKNLPTHHEKITIAQDQINSYQEVSSKIETLIDAANANSSKSAIVVMMKEIVPEFKSMNSTFEKLDLK